MGLLSLNAKQYDHALEWITRAIRQDPKPEYLASLGTTLQRQGRHEEALKALDKAVQLRPDDAELWRHLGDILIQLARFDQALLTFQHALKFNPRHWPAAFRSAVLFRQLGRLEEALAHFDLCDELQPRCASTIASRALVLRDMKRFEDYLAENRRAHSLDPQNAEICNNLGDGCLLLGYFEEALGWFDQALEYQPSFLAVLENKATVLTGMHRFDEAIAVYHHIRSIYPENASAEFGLAIVNLLLGNFEAGWKGREARWRVPGLPIALLESPAPIWLGEESIEGKTILVCSDEGFGDAIQLARYVPMLAARGARVVLVVQDSLRSLLSGLPGVSDCLSTSAATLPPAEFRCSAMSLPLAFGTKLDSIPRAIRLSPPLDLVKAWEQRLGPRDKLRVGVTWSGSLNHPNDSRRSIPLKSWMAILDVDATFFSLQRDPRPDDKAVLFERTDIIDLTANFTDFSETAALISCIDLVITVDTSIAHLAGTMGCPTWMMLPYTPDYRWLLDRDDSPWYPSMRLFRQDAARDYASVLDRVRDELRARIAAFGSQE
jgi:tetratricopeptide (TPR) repeat protein